MERRSGDKAAPPVIVDQAEFVGQADPAKVALGILARTAPGTGLEPDRHAAPSTSTAPLARQRS